MKHYAEQLQYVGISLANIFLILSFAFDSEVMLYVSLIAWLAVSIFLLLQNRHKSKAMTVVYSVLSVGIICVILIIALL